NDTIDEIEEKFQQKHLKTIGIATGFDALDHLTSGFQRGDLIILAGRPSMGKTAFALNLARNAAVEEGVGVGIFSLEMSDMQLVQRLLCAEGLINLQNLRTGRLTEKEWTRLPQAAGVLAEAPIYIDDTPALDMNRLTARARRMVMEKGVGFIIIDYLQLMEAPRGFHSRQEEISYISRSLKGLAKNLNVPVLALSQLSRAVEARPDKRPTLADLRESGAIEQDADLVMFVFREEVYLRRDKDEARLKEVENLAEIIIGKHRNGPIGTVKLTFLKHLGKFSNLPQVEDYGPIPQNGGDDVGF
ncbi:MAG TPA: replicative DNA helicase, partial [Calditrichae bacterium]|nr:replicative DNA helicase [Calditrichia bacterium]